MATATDRLENTADTGRNRRAFDLWAPTYDKQANPLLLLEQRYMERLLPEICGKHVLDAGCGSGRWLERLAGKSPRRLCGIDASAEMLCVASQKTKAQAELVRGFCHATPFQPQCFDLILASFVLSYVHDHGPFAAEMSRIAREGCDLFISDMHPETEMRLGWKRAFHDGRHEIALDSVRYSIKEVIASFEALGWKLCVAIEPEFGAPEHSIFAAAGRLNQLHEAAGHPAIYVLHLRKSAKELSDTAHRQSITICNARCALGAEETVAASLQVSGDRIARVAAEPYAPLAETSTEIDLSGYMLMPGLVNAHDHLEFALFPRLAGSVYPNASTWAWDIHRRFAGVIARQRSVPRDVRLWWGGLRNLLCGVTTVCHHNPLEPGMLREDFPVRVVRDFGWSHSLSFGDNLRQTHATTPKDSPFIVHACEGIDQEARDEIRELDRLGVLDSNTVLIHGLALDADGVALMRERGTSLVLCPTSNHFLFSEAPKLHLLGDMENVAIGSDSPLTAAGDFLDELRMAARLCNISPRRLYSMATGAPANILKLRNGEGTVAISGRADLIAIRDTRQSVATRLRDLSASDVELAMIGGRVHFASDPILERLPFCIRVRLEPMQINGTRRWIRGPVGDLLRQAERALGTGRARIGGKHLSVPSSSEALHVHG